MRSRHRAPVDAAALLDAAPTRGAQPIATPATRRRCVARDRAGARRRHCGSTAANSTPACSTSADVLDALRRFATAGRGGEVRVLLQDPAAPQRAHRPAARRWRSACRAPSCSATPSRNRWTAHYPSAFVANDAAATTSARSATASRARPEPDAPGPRPPAARALRAGLGAGAAVHASTARWASDARCQCAPHALPSRFARAAPARRVRQALEPRSCGYNSAPFAPLRCSRRSESRRMQPAYASPIEFPTAIVDSLLKQFAQSSQLGANAAYHRRPVRAVPGRSRTASSRNGRPTSTASRAAKPATCRIRRSSTRSPRPARQRRARRGCAVRRRRRRRARTRRRQADHRLPLARPPRRQPRPARHDGSKPEAPDLELGFHRLSDSRPRRRVQHRRRRRPRRA